DASGNGNHGTINWGTWVTEGTGPTTVPPTAVAPFDAVTARQHQQAWADYLGLPIEKEIELPGGTKLALVLIPPGVFQMGSSKDDLARFVADANSNGDTFAAERIPSEGPQHLVTISRPFYLGKFEVTRGQWHSVMDGNPSQAADDSQLPIDQVSWNDIQQFLERLNASGKSSDLTFALPTEAQWEFACRAGTTTPWCDAKDEEGLQSHSWFKSNSGGTTHTVGMLPPNALGVHDVHGNVWELCADWFAADAYQAVGTVDPRGPATGKMRVRRGGGWGSQATNCRSATRGDILPESSGIDTGLRLAASIDKSKVAARQMPSTKPAIAVAPFETTQAKQHQQAWADYLGVPVEATNSVGAKMVLIPPGSFQMGSTDEQVEAALKMSTELHPNAVNRIQTYEQQHEVMISRQFLMGVTEVTVGQFRKFVQATKYITQLEERGFTDEKGVPLEAAVVAGFEGRKWNAPGYVLTDDMPVTYLYWKDAESYCQWLSQSESVVYRLPTEAEWEYACRAGTTTQFSFGDDFSSLGEHAWKSQNSGGQPHQVGTKLPNSFGLYDMHGNVKEICLDWYKDEFYRDSPKVDPLNVELGNARKVERGGSWFSFYPAEFRSATRSFQFLKTPKNLEYYGFRVVRVLDVPMN
ncbi:MAG: hypothetical protein B7Z55_02045, partial [Planctomycetales bacterium 12-60-4]